MCTKAGGRFSECTSACRHRESFSGGCVSQCFLFVYLTCLQAPFLLHKPVFSLKSKWVRTSSLDLQTFPT